MYCIHCSVKGAVARASPRAAKTDNYRRSASATPREATGAGVGAAPAQRRRTHFARPADVGEPARPRAAAAHAAAGAAVGRPAGNRYHWRLARMSRERMPMFAASMRIEGYDDELAAAIAAER